MQAGADEARTVCMPWPVMSASVTGKTGYKIT
jgi:hypothetical protein